MLTRLCRYILCITVITAMISVIAPARTFIAFAAGEAEEDRHISLWKLSGQESRVYLLGSIHLLKESDYPLDRRIYSAFEEAENIVFEANLDSINTPTFQKLIMDKAFFQGDRNLKSVLSDSVYSMLEAELESTGMDIIYVNRFKPWFAALMLDQIELQRLGYSMTAGIDYHLFKRAKARGKKILWLETPRFQIELFSSMPIRNQENFLYQTILEYHRIEKYLNRIVRGWKRGNLELIENIMNKGMDEFPEIRERMLNRRNRKWVEEIKTFIQDSGDYLVVVGVGHMSGENGLIDLLEKEGFKLEQL